MAGLQGMRSALKGGFLAGVSWVSCWPTAHRIQAARAHVPCRHGVLTFKGAAGGKWSEKAQAANVLVASVALNVFEVVIEMPDVNQHQSREPNCMFQSGAEVLAPAALRALTSAAPWNFLESAFLCHDGSQPVSYPDCQPGRIHGCILGRNPGCQPGCLPDGLLRVCQTAGGWFCCG